MKKMKLGRNIKYGLGSTIAAVVLIAILIVVNLFVNSLSQNYPLKADLTKNQLYKLSDYTVNLLSSLEQDVNIYALYNESNKNNSFMEILYRYQRESEKIHVEAVSPASNPSFSVKYDTTNQGLSEGSIIFDCNGKYKVVSETELTNYSSYTGQSTQLYAEEKFTQALEYVTSDKMKTIYLLSGHGEDNGLEFSEVLQQSNYDKKEVTLYSGPIPEEAQLLIILSPRKDFSPDEISRLDEYLAKGGGLFVTLAPEASGLNNFMNYLDEWGITSSGEVVLEGDNQKVAFNTPYTFFASSAGHDITFDLFSNNLLVLIGTTKPVYANSTGSAMASALMTTSEKAYLQDLSDPDSQPVSKGKISIAATSEKEGGGKIAVFGSNQYLLNDLFKEPNLANKELFLNTVSWLEGDSSNTGIRPKSLVSETLMISEAETISIIMLAAFLPLAIIIIGIIVWIRRRHR